MIRFIILFCFLFSFSSLVFGQSEEISVLVADQKSEAPLIGVNIQIKDVVLFTDINGLFYVKTDFLPAKLVVSYVGYQTVSFIWSKREDVPKTIYLAESETTLDMITVTGSKYEQNITKSTDSIDILKPDLLRSVIAVGAD